jgi:hypothetical protein
VVFRHLCSQIQVLEIEFQDPGSRLSTRSRDLKSRAIQDPGITTPCFPGSSFLEQQKQLKHHDFGRDAQFSLTYGRMCLKLEIDRFSRLDETPANALDKLQTPRSRCTAGRVTEWYIPYNG